MPLESILNHSREGLAAVAHAVELERRAVSAQLAAAANSSAAAGAGTGGAAGAAGAGDPLPLVSYFSSIHAGWGESEFDSGAESDCGSDLTDMDSAWD